MVNTKEELEIKANKDILEDVKKLLDKYTPHYIGTDALLDLSRCGDKLIVREMLNKIPDTEKTECVYCGTIIIKNKNRQICYECNYEINPILTGGIA